MRVRGWGAIGAFLALAASCPTAGAYIPILNAYVSPTDSSDVVDKLVDFPLCFRGKLVRIEFGQFSNLGGGGLESRQNYFRSRITIEEVEPLAGICEGSVLTLMGLDDGPYSPARVGDEVVGYAFRDIHDGWRLFGWILYPVGDLGEVRGDLWTSTAIRDGKESRPARLDEIVQGVRDRRDQHALSALEGAMGLWSARIVGREHSERGLELEVEPEHQWLGQGYPPSRRVRFPWRAKCLVGYDLEDRILLPASETDSAEALLLETCPRSLLVKDGFAQGLGVPLERIGDALELRSGRIHVRDFLLRTSP